MKNAHTRATALLLGAALMAVSAPALAESVRAALTRLADTHRFTIENAERLGDEAAPPETGSLASHVAALLKHYSHVLVADPNGGVERIIVGKRRVAPASGAATIVALDPSGQRLRAEVEIEAPSGRRLRAALIVDTGASLVVLPASALETLAIPVEDRTPIELQTANGRTQGVKAELAALTLGRQRIEKVSAAFVADELLGSAGLLGQNVLGRFQMTIDVANARLLLLPR